MPQMIIYRGFPASGKSTKAREWVAQDPENRIEINRDNTRILIGVTGKLGDKHQEALVTSINDDILNQSVAAGKDIVISNTNLRVKYVKTFVRIALENDYDVSIVDFKELDLDELLARDANRDDPAGEKAIRAMWEKFPYNRWMSAEKIINEVKKKIEEDGDDKFTPYRNDPTLPWAIIVDVDGTIANHTGVRNVYDYSQVYYDTPHEDIIRLVQLEAATGTKVIIMSGREDCCKEDTIRWLEKYDVPFDDVFMRKTGDKRPDYIIKDELIRENVQDNYHVIYGLDDRNSVVNHNREMGYRILAVAPGDF